MILGHPNPAIVGAHPNDTSLQWRFSKGGDGTKLDIALAIDAVRVVSGQVWADFLPYWGSSAIDCCQDCLSSVHRFLQMEHRPLSGCLAFVLGPADASPIVDLLVAHVSNSESQFLTPPRAHLHQWKCLLY